MKNVTGGLNYRIEMMSKLVFPYTAGGIFIW